MRKRGDRALKELYEITDRISEPEITPVLEGSCRIQGPVDESDHELLRTNSGIFPSEKRYVFANENLSSRAESGTCNVCYAPCSSCMHLNRTASAMESKIECSFPGNIYGRKEADSCSFIGVDGLPFYKSRTCNNHLHAASEASNLLSSSSCHDSYSENAESKGTLRASVTYDAVDMPPKVSSSAAVGDDQLVPMKTSVNAHSLFSSQSCIIPDINHKGFINRDKEQHVLECHGDNISCITGVKEANATIIDHNMDLHKKDVACSAASTSSLLAKGVEDAVQVEPSCGFLHDHEIEESHINSRRSSTYHKESLRKRNAVSGSANAGFSDKSEIVEFPPSGKIPSPKARSPSSHPQKGYPFHHETNSEELERNPNSRFQVEPSQCLVENAVSSLGQFPSGNLNGRKLTALSNNEDITASYIKSDNSLVALKDTGPCLKTEIGMDGRILSDEVVKCITTNEQHGNTISFMETFNMQEPQMHPQSKLEGENSESDVALDDVKVCDICGDAGREELLAICSRCADGAEHTYCMRKMLDKLPEGDWLCEECKIKDTGNSKSEKSDSVSNLSKLPCLNENDKRFVSNFNPKLLPKLDTKNADPKATGAIEGLQSPQVPATWHADNRLDSSITSKNAVEPSGGSIGTASPRKKTVLSRESSFKNLDTGKVMPVNMGSSCGGQSANLRLQTSFGSNSFKVPVPLHSPRVPISRSFSFNSSSLKGSPKVKQLIESVPHKPKSPRESTSGDTRKEGLVRTLTKSASFKNASHNNIVPVGKTTSLNSSRGRDPSDSKQVKERNMGEKNDFPVHDQPLISPSPVASTVIPHPKGDIKVAHDGKLNNASQSKSHGINKGSVNANGCKETKKLPSYLSRSFGSQVSSGVSNSEDQKPYQVPKAAESRFRDDKTKESTLSSSSKQPVSGGNRILRCQRCKETGHATQFCPIDKLSISALRPSIERNLREGVKKSNKWKDAVEATHSKTRIQKNKKLPDQTEEFSMPCEDLSCGVVTKDILSCSSSSPTDLPCLEGTTRGEETLRSSDAEPCKTAAAIDIKRQAMHPMEALYVPTASDLIVFHTISDESRIKSSIESLPDQGSILTNSLRASAIPELEFIWQGDFEVLRTGRLPELFEGIQAHLSSCASPKVLEVVTKFPYKVQLEEVPRNSSWPLQFQCTGPKEENIALFFFAKDVESYEKNYRKLLENMLANDLALRGKINSVELLIFPSNNLPANSQRWNSLFFFWGVFRGRRTNCVGALLDSQKKPCGSILRNDPLVQDLPSPLFNDVSNFQNINSCENPETELFRCDRSSKAKALMSSSSVDYRPISSSGVDDGTCSTGVSPLVGNSLCQAAIHNKQPSECTSCSLPVSCSLENMNQLPSLLDSSPKSRLQLSTKTLCREGSIDTTYQKNLGSDSEVGKVGQPPAPADSNRRLNTEGSGSAEQIKERGKLIKSEAASEDDAPVNLTESDHRSWESRRDGKRPRSCSVETLSRASGGETSKCTDEEKPPKERENCISVEDGRERKKMKPYWEEGHASSCSRDENPSSRSSSKVHPLLACVLHEEQRRDDVCKETGMAERCFFSVDLGPVRDTKRDWLVHVLSSDDEDSPESTTPNLELALGGKERSTKQRALPLLFPVADRSQDRRTIHPASDDDVLSSLSLSLALPSSRARPILKTEELAPDRPDINTSLYLFGGFPDT